jgi:transmembrane sensor
MKSFKNDELSVALEALRDRPIVSESRDYAHRWERTRARVESIRGKVFRAAGGVAAVCALATVAFFMLPGVPQHRTKQGLVETPVSETLAVALEDGSHIVLDRSSRLRVAYTSTGRDVELLEGQAHFEVAKDAHRPFRVHTKSAEVVAVGTTFDVSALPSSTKVTLIEGRVNVSTTSDRSAAEPHVKVLSPGQQLEITADGQLLDNESVNVENVTAWQRGVVVIDDEPLPEALEVMNRYSPTHIVVQGGPALQARRISGVFRVGDVETEALVLQKYFGLRETGRSSTQIVLAK